jgi:hypothetical protein
VFTNAQGPHDWNAELIEPVFKAISSGWEKTFSRRVSNILRSFASKAASSMKSFHEAVQTRASRNGGTLATLYMLSQQLHNYQQLFKDLSDTNSATVVAQAKEINRMFQPVIAEAIGPAYAACSEERGMTQTLPLPGLLLRLLLGTGCYKRMKEHMTTHIDRTRQTMFHDSTNKVKQSLEGLMESVEENMLAKADDVFLSVKRDYSSALIGGQSATEEALPRDQRIIRKEVLEIITGSERIFKRVIGLEPEEDEQDGVGQELKVEPTGDAVAAKPRAFNEEELVERSRVNMEGDDRSDIDVNGTLIAPKPESQEEEGSQLGFQQFKPEDKDQQCMVDQQLLQCTESAADLFRISSDVSAVDDQSIEDWRDDDSDIASLDEGL